MTCAGANLHAACSLHFAVILLTRLRRSQTAVCFIESVNTEEKTLACLSSRRAEGAAVWQRCMMGLRQEQRRRGAVGSLGGRRQIRHPGSSSHPTLVSRCRNLVRRIQANKMIISGNRGRVRSRCEPLRAMRCRKVLHLCCGTWTNHRGDESQSKWWTASYVPKESDPTFTIFTRYAC